MNFKLLSGGGKGKTTWPDTTLGTVTGAANVGTGLGKVWRDLVAGVLNFKSIKAGTNVSVTNGADDITIDASGEANTAANVGTGAGLIYRDKVGVNLNLKTIKAGTNLTVANNADDITLSGPVPGEANTAANVGTGAGLIYRDKVGVNLNLKTIKAGTNLTVANNADDITLSGPVPGEANTAANVGTGAGLIYRDKVGVNLNLKTIKAGANITVTNNADDVTLAAAGGGAAPVNAISFVASSFNFNDAAPATLIVNKPAGVVDGDILLAFVAIDLGFTLNCTTAGWIQLQGSPTRIDWSTLFVFYKIAAGEGANYTFNLSGAGYQHVHIGITAYRNVDTFNPFGAYTHFTDKDYNILTTLPKILINQAAQEWAITAWATGPTGTMTMAGAFAGAQRITDTSGLGKMLAVFDTNGVVTTAGIAAPGTISTAGGGSQKTPWIITLRPKTSYYTPMNQNIFLKADQWVGLNGEEPSLSSRTFVDVFSQFTVNILQFVRGDCASITLRIPEDYCTQLGTSAQVPGIGIRLYWTANRTPADAGHYTLALGAVGVGHKCRLNYAPTTRALYLRYDGVNDILYTSEEVFINLSASGTFHSTIQPGDFVMIKVLRDDFEGEDPWDFLGASVRFMTVSRLEQWR